MKALETVYQGCRFRSRLEARWAVVLDALGVAWQYEAEGFDLGDVGWYLPDFYVPLQKQWIEIKPTRPDLLAILKAQGLSCFRRERVEIFVGLPAPAELMESQPQTVHIYPKSSPPGRIDWFPWFEQFHSLITPPFHRGISLRTDGRLRQRCEDALAIARSARFDGHDRRPVTLKHN